MTKMNNLANILKKYADGWVSVSHDYKRVLAYGRTFKAVIEKLAKKGNPDGFIMRAVKDYSRYAGITYPSTN